MLIKVGNTVASVDKEDYIELSKYQWHLDKGYAYGYVKINGERKHSYMHNFLLKTPKGLVTDHINCNKLDNRRKNLRICTKAENNLNKKNKGSIFWNKRKNRWEVQYRHKYLGRTKTKEEAEKILINMGLK